MDASERGKGPRSGDVPGDGSEDSELARQSRRAWRDFRRRLADVLAELPADGDLVVRPYDANARGRGEGSPHETWRRRPHVSLRVVAGRLRAEVPGNRGLEPGRGLGADQLQRMRTLGWSDPASSTGHLHHLDLEQREADRAAVIVVRTLQEVFGVLHPALLQPSLPQAGSLHWGSLHAGAEGLEGLFPAAAVEGPIPDGLDAAAGNGPDPDTVGPRARMVTLVRPRDSDELRRHVGSFLDQVLADQVREQEDGGWLLWAGPCPVVLSVRDHAPVVDIESRVLEQVLERERALLEVNIRNRDSDGLRFFLHGDVILARMDVAAMPWAPSHLVRAVREFRRHVELTAIDLAQRLGGRRMLDPDPQPPLAPPAPWTPDNRRHAERLEAIRDLRRSGSADADLVAALHEDDRTQIVQQILWVRRTGAGGAEEQDQSLLDLLRAALRLVADRESQPRTRPQ